MANLTQSSDSTETAGATSPAKLDMKIEVMVIPVSDPDRAKEFYLKLGWRLDQTPPGVVQLTPHGSAASLQFGKVFNLTTPGSGLGYVVVPDIEVARNALIAAGVDVGEIFHLGPNGPVNGLDPERRTYRSRAFFSDPDGNRWLLQEITSRLPGRVDPGPTAFNSASDLASALRRAAVAHGNHERRMGKKDENWPDWYAEYLVREQTGDGPPTDD